jgi:transcriptional regulator with XRE-family HTH domain
MVNELLPTVSSEQVRAARAWLNWSQAVLAQEAGVSTGAVNRFEQGVGVPHSETTLRLQNALERAGFRFSFDKMVGVGLSREPVAMSRVEADCTKEPMQQGDRHNFEVG